MKYYQHRLQSKYKTEERKRLYDLHFEKKKKIKIEAHKKRYRKIWRAIESKIAVSAGSAKNFGRRTLPFNKTSMTASTDPSEGKSDRFNLSNSNLKSTLNLIIEQEKNKLQFTTRESFLHKERTVKYVVREILQKFNEDLSDSVPVVEAMCKKLEKFFAQMKQQQVRVRFFDVVNETEGEITP